MLFGILFILPSAYAQQTVFDEFRKVAGDYAALYSGKAEVSYNQNRYLNHPYWDTDEFRKGAVCYQGWLYSDLLLRYDTHKKSLVLVTPEKRILLQADMRKVEYFIIDGQKFVPYGDSYAALLYESPQMSLKQYVVTTIDTQAKKENRYYNQFKKNIYFSIHKDGTDYTVTSRSGFLKLFPACCCCAKVTKGNSIRSKVTIYLKLCAFIFISYELENRHIPLTGS
jgi:hypothetical protein